MITTKNRQAFTVRQLRAVLETLPGDATVILSSDEEGNAFGVLFGIEKKDNGNVIFYPASGTVELE